MRLPAAIAAVLVLSALPAGAERPEPRDTFRRESPARAEFRRAPSLATYRAMLHDDLEAAGFEGLSHVESGVTVDAKPVGDLDGDGRPDVVERVVDGPSDRSTIRARRGVDGRALWSRNVAGRPYFTSARLGPQGGAGLLLVVDALTPVGGKAWQHTRTLTAIDAAGATAWEQSFPSVAFSSFDTPARALGTAGYPYIAGVFDGLAGPADDLLVVLDSAVVQFALPGPFLTATATPLVLDGGNGRIVHPVGPMEYAVESSVRAHAVPDMSGDGLGDVVLLSQTFGPPTPTSRLAAYEATGRPLWAVADQYVDYVWAVGDVSGDRRGDVAAWSFGEGGFVPQVRSGADGSVLGHLAGEVPYPLGDVDRDGRGDIGTLSAIRDKAGFALLVDAYAGDGRRIHRRRVPFPVKAGHFTYITVAEAGDVQPDGNVELAVEIEELTPSFKRVATWGGLLDGRTGAKLHGRRPVRMSAAAVDGRGDDHVEVGRPKPGILAITAYQGTTGAPLWQSTVRHPKVDYALSAATRLDGDACADAIVTATLGTSAILLAVRGRDGRLLWGREVTPSGERPYAGLIPGVDRNPGC